MEDKTLMVQPSASQEATAIVIATYFCSALKMEDTEKGIKERARLIGEVANLMIVKPS